MWADINGERKKVACGPCIRGHRSSKCDHRDRVLIEVRKPGRPLSSCPHPSGSCSCERVVINYTIPKASECACPSERSQTILSANSSGRVQKSRHRKSTTTINQGALEKAIKATQDGETDTSSILTQTASSESNGASPPSSASSTPRLVPSRKQSQSAVLPQVNTTLPTADQSSTLSQEPSSCCKPKPAPLQGGSCCANKKEAVPQPVAPQKSCCSGSMPTTPMQPQFAPPHIPANPLHDYNSFGHYHAQPQHVSYDMMNQGNHFMPMPPPFSFNTPIHNHMVSVYQSPPSMPMAPASEHTATHAPEHNCHCGDSCSCFGCAAHPNNATMIEYVRSMHQYMSTGGFGTLPPPNYDMPSYPHHPGFGAEVGISFNNNTAPANFVTTGQMSFQTNVHGTVMTNAPSQMTNTWPQHLMSEPHSTIDTQYFQNNNLAGPGTQEAPSSLKTEEVAQSPAFVDSPDEDKDAGTPTLSPSSFFWQEVELPGCSDATGTCQCGDGCTCVGCLTHGGHNGVPLDPLPTSIHEAFPKFTDSGSGPNRTDSAGFMAFSNAPT